MNTINQTDKELKRIEAKQTLGLPLTAHETALLTLYGTTERVRAAGDVYKSQVRYWWREYKARRGAALPPYNSIWFEAWASALGEKHFK